MDKAKTLSEQKRDLESQVETLSTELKEAREREAGLAQDFANADVNAKKATAEVANLGKKIVELQEQLVARGVEIEDLKKAVEEAKASAGKQAQEAMAQIGVPAVDGETAPPVSVESLKSQYEQLSKTDPVQAREFWKKNETKLSTPQMLAWKKQNGL